ncbi:MAG: hypothetical protein AAGU75_19995 [Bacillota bacterium]
MRYNERMFDKSNLSENDLSIELMLEYVNDVSPALDKFEQFLSRAGGKPALDTFKALGVVQMLYTGWGLVRPATVRQELGKSALKVIDQERKRALDLVKTLPRGG